MDGGNVIFKFTGDDKQLQSTLKSLGSIGKTALTGIVARNYGSSGSIYDSCSTKC